MEPTPHNLRSKGCAGERSLPRRSMAVLSSVPASCIPRDASSLAPYLPPRSTGGTYPTCARPMDTCKPRPTGTGCSPSRPTAASSRSISKSAGTSSTHSLQAVPIRSPTAQDKLHRRMRLRAACIRVQAVLIRLQVPRLSVLRAATRAACLDGRRRRGENAAGTRLYYYSKGRKGGRGHDLAPAPSPIVLAHFSYHVCSASRWPASRSRPSRSSWPRVWKTRPVWPAAVLLEHG